MSMTAGHVHVRGNAPIHFNVYVHVHLHVHVLVRAVYMLHLILILILILYVHAFPIIHATVPEGFNQNSAKYCRSYGDTISQIIPSCPNTADSIDVMMVKPILGSSCDVVPLNFKTNSCPLHILSIPIVGACFRALIVLVRQYL
jgi:hypothetical protein